MIVDVKNCDSGVSPTGSLVSQHVKFTKSVMLCIIQLYFCLWFSRIILCEYAVFQELKISKRSLIKGQKNATVSRHTPNRVYTK